MYNESIKQKYNRRQKGFRENTPFVTKRQDHLSVFQMPHSWASQVDCQGHYTAFWKEISNICAAVAFACSHTVDRWRIKQNSECQKFLKNYFFFYPTSSKPASSQSSYLLGIGSEGVEGGGGKEGTGRRGVIDEGDIKGCTSAHTQLSEPDQLHFIRNLRPIAAGSQLKCQCF